VVIDFWNRGGDTENPGGGGERRNSRVGPLNCDVTLMAGAKPQTLFQGIQGGGGEGRIGKGGSVLGRGGKKSCCFHAIAKGASQNKGGGKKKRDEKWSTPSTIPIQKEGISGRKMEREGDVRERGGRGSNSEGEVNVT